MIPEKIVTEARSWIGTPYRHQGSCKGAGADCLGLLRGIWRAGFGPEPTDIPAYTPDWSEASRTETLFEEARALMAEVPRDEARPGDVILFRMRDGAVAKHLGILANPFPKPTFVHAYSGHGVVENTLSDPWQRRVAAYFRFPEKG